MERAELEANLQEYRAQLQQVRPPLCHQTFEKVTCMPDEHFCAQVETLLVSDAENTEYAEIYDNLSEVRLSITLLVTIVPFFQHCSPNDSS